MSVGIICEYNPFHNGHLYHLNKIKEMYPNDEIILILNGNFTERGDISIIEKYDKALIALENNINLVIELPFKYGSESADSFSYAAIKILSLLKCDYLVFGSESNNIDMLIEKANIQINDNYNAEIKKYLDKGYNYPTSMSKALNIDINTPNDILSLSYIREIIKQKSNIKPISIKRTNDYHDKTLKDEISSATSIRKAILENKSINKYVPKETIKYINNINYKEEIFKLLKYKVITEKENISLYQTVDEGLENRIIKVINEVNTLDELIEKIKTKRYTYNKINRMIIHIITSYTKKEAKEKEINYIKVLGFDNKGKEYLKKIKKEIKIPIITNINKNNYNLLEFDIRIDNIYNLIMKRNNNILNSKPIIKEQ